jgi:lipooligosaccharide transport system permease protein
MMPDLSWRFVAVWRRNLAVYRKIWLLNFLPPLLEPLLFIVAFGYGLAGVAGRVTYAGAEIPYAAFIAPALAAVAAMYNSFFETTYASFVRMVYQRTFQALMATPLTLDEIVAGEIAWGATRSAIAASLMLVVLAPFGLIGWPGGLLLIPLAVLGGLAFGAIGLTFTGILPSIDAFNLPVFLFITPMFLFSGTFFPLENLPRWAAGVAWALPLTHLVDLCRGAALGAFRPGHLLSILYLAAIAAIFFALAIRTMRRRLIP